MNVLKLTDVEKHYPHPAGSVSVLHNINTMVHQGETVAIIGPSGSGKSTLLSLLAGLDHPTSGYVQVLGQDLGSLSEQELTRFRAKNLGIVFQQFHLMNHLTALENVSLPLYIAKKADAPSSAKTALNLVGLAARLNHYPHEMSGGECQRVAIARALVMRPALLLADEPSGNLDNTTGEQVMQLLFDLVQEQKTTLLLVTHNEDLANRCDRRLHLSQGQLHDG